jgi:hypothetical protein
MTLVTLVELLVVCLVCLTAQGINARARTAYRDREPSVAINLSFVLIPALYGKQDTIPP